MTDADRQRLERRVLLLAPTDRDLHLSRTILSQAGVECTGCNDLASVCAGLEAGAGAVLLAEEAFLADQNSCLDAWLARQPPWSDLPVLILSRPGADSAGVARSMELLGNVTVLERPTRVAALVSTVRTALRARQRQYQIRDQIQALREADRRKDEFLAILAHELRNPLAPIRSSLHILRLISQQDPEAESVAEMMERQVNHLVRLVDDLLEVSRLTESKVELRREPVEVAEIVRGAIETSQPLIAAGEHRLALSIPDEPLTLDGDAVRLTQVVANLLNNAAKYTGPGGRIWLTVRREPGGVAISVKDSGSGISAELLPRVFDLFTQGEDLAGRAQGGLGIGLTLVKSLVEMHGGSVQAFSQGTGRGSEFVVHLPLSPLRTTAEVPAAETGPFALAPRRVLVVDDNRDAAESLGRLLKLLGADVQVAYDGQEALEALAAEKPALVLLDIGMPGMDGHEVARRIRRQPELQDVTLIAVTGWGQEDDRHRSQTAGFDGHLIKPADIGSLEKLLASLEAARKDARRA